MSPRRRAEDDPLAPYSAKRNFHRNGEPQGGRKPSPDDPRFVVQQHDARPLHYDVRLEAAGVLKSWAVPRGPLTDPQDKRLAVPAEYHPLDYAEFGGVIPKGEYGAGPVIVGDAGTFRNLTEHRGRPVTVENAVERGHVAVWLEGEKLRGGHAFTRIQPGTWLMVRMRDAEAASDRSPVRDQPASILTGRTLADLSADAW